MKLLSLILASLPLTEGHRHSHRNHLNDFVRDPYQSRIDVLQYMEYQHHHKQPAKSLEHWRHPIACGLCTAGLKPLDWFFESPTIRSGLERVALSVCINRKIYGGVPSVCKGAIDMMAVDVLPALA